MKRILLGALVWCLTSIGAWALTSTATTITVTANGRPLTVVEAYTVVRLTAITAAGAEALKKGQVRFCDADAAFCEGSSLLGVQQITGEGAAILRFVPPPGTHHYKAVFVGTRVDASSVSASSTLVVRPAGSLSTTTSIDVSSFTFDNTLSAGVASTGAGAALSGTVYFEDRTDSNRLVGHVQLGNARGGLSLSEVPSGIASAGLLSSDSIAVADDFNLDGKVDLAITNPSAGATSPITILLGNGGGGFQPVPVSEPGLSPTAISKGDFDGDGRTDLAVADVATGKVVLLRGEGDGSFAAGSEIASIDTPEHIVTGDFNNDGNADLAVSASVHHSVTLLLGDGEGGFTKSQIDLPAKSFLRYVMVAADYDGDGHLDLALPGRGAAILLFGRGDGTFKVTSEKVSAPFAYVRNALSADFNGDGRNDLVVYLASGQTIILFVNKDQSFAQEEIYTTAPNPGRLQSADLNGDGFADLVMENLGGVLTTVFGRGDGSFSLPVGISIRLYPEKVPDKYGTLLTIADLNGDGIDDLVASVAPATKIRRVSGLLMQNKQTVTASLSALSGAGAHQIVARYDGDSHFLTSGSGPAVVYGPYAPRPVATFSAVELSFSNDQPLAEKSAAKTVVLTNTGDRPLAIDSIQLTGDPAFAISNDCPASLSPLNACKIRARFVPFSSGPRYASIVLNASQSISLSGTGRGESKPELFPADLVFNDQPAHVKSAVQTVTLTNAGDSALHLGFGTIHGVDAAEFATSNTCGRELAAGGSCDIRVRFTPHHVYEAGYIYQATVTFVPAEKPILIGLTGKLTGEGN